MRMLPPPAAALTLGFLLLATTRPPAASASWPPNGEPLCTESHAQTVPVITGDGSGGGIVVWPDDRAESDIYAQRVDANGAPLWTSNGVAVCSAPSRQLSPQVLPLPGASAGVFWVDERNSQYGIYAQQIDANGVSQWASNGIPLASSTAANHLLRTISDGNPGITTPRGWILLWDEDGGLHSKGLRMQHVDANQGGLWTSAAVDGFALVGGLDYLGDFDMATDGVGTTKGAVVVWSESPSGSSGTADLYATRISGSGAVQWAHQAVCTATGEQNEPDVVNVGTGVVVTAWIDRRTASQGYDIYAQKLNSTGVAQWTPDGAPVCRGTGDQRRPKLLSDGAGGVFVVWMDGRSGQRVYAQRLNASGAPLWSTDGIPLSDVAGSFDVDGPSLTSDGAGGFIAVWEDDRTGGRNVFAQRVDANGNLLWPAYGIPVALSNDQSREAIVGDLNSGAIVAWMDGRSGNNFDIYANRVFANGTVVSVAPAPVSRMELSLVSSSPSPGDVRVSLALPQASLVTGDVLDPSGRRVRTLMSDMDMAAGTHAIDWDGADATGAAEPDGIYFIRVRTRDAEGVIRVAHLR